MINVFHSTQCFLLLCQEIVIIGGQNNNLLAWEVTE